MTGNGFEKNDPKPASESGTRSPHRPPEKKRNATTVLPDVSDTEEVENVLDRKTNDSIKHRTVSRKRKTRSDDADSRESLTKLLKNKVAKQRVATVLSDDSDTAEQNSLEIKTKNVGSIVIKQRTRRKKEKPIPKKSKAARKLEVTTPCIHGANLPYDNDALPDIRYPTFSSVPDHLLAEFRNIFPRHGKELIPDDQIPGKGIDFMENVIKFYTVEKLSLLANIFLKKNTDVTMTLLDWLCTNYSVSHNTRYNIPERTENDFNIQISYDQNVHARTRLYFDYYARKPKIVVEYHDPSFDAIPEDLDAGDGEIIWDKSMLVGARVIGGKKMVYLITSVGQLIFFQWVLSNWVLNYCELNLKSIKLDKKLKKSKQRLTGKRRRLSEAAPMSWFVCAVAAHMKYDIASRDVKKIYLDSADESAYS